MMLLDTNVLFYAVHAGSRYHTHARNFLDGAVNSGAGIALPWIAIVGFLRLTTNRAWLPNPLGVEEASDRVERWLAQPNVTALDPGPGHWGILRDLFIREGHGGDIANDAHLAALAIEHDAELCSYDQDFAKFKGLRWMNLLRDA